jgi:hypothetical protein
MAKFSWFSVAEVSEYHLYKIAGVRKIRLQQRWGRFDLGKAAS